MQTDFVDYFRLMKKRLATTDPEDLHLRSLSFQELVLLGKVPRNLKLTLPLLTAVTVPGSMVIVPFFFLNPKWLPRELRSESQAVKLDSTAILASQLGPAHEITRILERDDIMKQVVKRAKSNGFPETNALLATAPLFAGKYSLDSIDYSHLVCNIIRVYNYLQAVSMWTERIYKIHDKRTVAA
ncbi:hypothetical protein Ciccas_006230 [Cichlidogyrus casuarinus]|uniref:Letm1 RBD domain-containing protein n=1 Tax=Cichlidogyrus casuarinus TaxID=1844966 RepID=A0ABD2Q6E4_9PLAT